MFLRIRLWRDAGRVRVSTTSHLRSGERRVKGTRDGGSVGQTRGRKEGRRETGEVGRKERVI